MKITVVVLFGILAFPSEVLAARNAYRCNGCSEAQYYSAATGPQELGVRYVYDFVNANIRKYQVTREPNGHGFTYYADPLTVVPAEQAYFDAAVQVWNSNGAYLKVVATLNVTPTVPGAAVIGAGANAYEIVRSSSMQNRIGDWISQVGSGSSAFPTSFEQRLRDIIVLLRTSPANIVLEDKDLGKLTITLFFTNGHRVTFVWKKDEMPKMTEARDSNDNTIPVSVSDMNGRQFDFSGGNGQDGGYFGEHADILGAIYDNVCGGQIIACITFEGHITCKPYPKCP
ncbi:MAG TPA: hypothetical protein VFN25_05760 [Dokdonella sp.]|uniref:hypothetical protein n=1 Tax=Dokdonella sp. TaxID=2291710 RepID=UPI002D7EC113|nr:hypothetical protein [Dokdonella sp.]HET9032395.1 hypothetical protein [Dokdonella sp.]